MEIHTWKMLYGWTWLCIGLSKFNRVSGPPEFPTDLIRKPADLTPVTGRQRFLRYPTRFRWVGWRVLASKPDFNRPDWFYYQWGRWSPPYIRFLSWISPDPAWFYRGQAKSLWDSARSSHTRPVLGQIYRISARSLQFSARFGEFWPNLTPTETRPLPMKNRPIQPDSLTGRRRVWMLVTRLGRVGCGLDTNPTRTNPWSPLIMHVNMSPLYFGCYLGMSK